jgi:hypothetical protein
MKFKDYLIDFGKWLLRLLIGVALIFGPLMLAVEFMEPSVLWLYLASATIITRFLVSYFKKR